MSQSNRIPGGLIDRSGTLSFTFDGRSYQGHPGDTLASGLLANGVRLMGRSFKYHRPRGPISAGSDEPNALVELRTGARQEPNTRATVAELFDGLSAQSQNRWPSLAFDALAINDRLSPFFAAGFYYKTFMWPAAFWEKVYEPIIRRAAGLGSLSRLPDPDVYDKGFLHCDILVIGAGPSGLAAALTAGRSGARVILADEDFRMGGRLTAETQGVGGLSGADWTAQALAELSGLPNVRLMTRTTVVGAFDHGIYGAVERVSDHVPVPAEGKPRQILWRIYARRAILAAGATERMIAFEDNDRPGIMLAGAVRAYANRWGVAAGRRVAVFTNNDDGLRTAADLRAKGLEIAAVIDSRKGEEVTGSAGRLGLRSIKVRDGSGRTRTVECDALAVSGGWNPNLHLTSHHRGRPVWDEAIAAFVPGPGGPAGLLPAGAAAGHLTTHGALKTGAKAAAAALADLGHKAAAFDLPEAEDAPVSITPKWHVPGKGRAWVDPQNDVTVKDVKLAHQEGFRSVEHLKRYTTLGMATDQGKAGNVLGLAVMAEMTGQSIPETGTTIYRPPYTPVAMGALAGRSREKDFKPTRLTPSHKWAAEQGAVFVEVGMWLRAQWFPKPGETHWRQSVDREVLATRASAGICDVTTLGKIDIQGKDAGAFLNRVYANTFATLPVGKVRYGLMLREDGIVMDDGTTARLAEDEWVMTTTTANAVPVFRHLEFCRQCLWPDMDVQLISTTEAWAQFSVAGPNARRLLEKVVDQDISDAAFPYMACANITVCGGLRARLFRISFSGELAYEIAVPTRYGDAMIRALMKAGEEFDAVAYGTEALGVMRVEKGHVAGNELNGQSTALNMGLGKMVSKKKDAIGMVLSQREGMVAKDGLRLVGVKPVDPSQPLTAGSHFIAMGKPATAAHDDGWLTSVVYSPHLGHSIALGYLKDGSARMGERLRTVNLLKKTEVEVEIVSPHFIDPEGERLRA
ncbi:sarcosine oxidase subunit alpha family protein [Albidovulum sp.]|uniref:sarcosine oxidase subunit alpha family protein n=1 Tax=Albidovulum sp. TaxID=1872424 RepID=UPI0033867561|nr:sarcosine oxidase subunit alpha family protein [Defluviimonas sp.]MCP5323644.1 sarcosine oxidase subunit alpha family protein [Paracoccaceae bacterium]MCP5354923.1 sarcosine oxidase subunit alpha family protein [Paracoccaceae bacterium]